MYCPIYNGLCPTMPLKGELVGLLIALPPQTPLMNFVMFIYITWFAPNCTPQKLVPGTMFHRLVP